MQIREAILQRLAVLQPNFTELTDDSHLHAGHTGAQGGGHYNLKIISTAFTGKPAVARHRMVYAALSDLMTDKVHALSITALTPDETAR